MQRLLFITMTVVVLILATPLAQGEPPIDETRFTLRQELLRLINRDRRQHGLAPVELDPAVSTFADGYCRQQIRNGTTGHFTTDGLAPYARYSFSGGNDGVSENAAAWSANYTFKDRALYQMMRSSEDAMMAEVAPHDGHRKTILDPYATHVGLGMAWEKGEFRLAQEFLRRYLTWAVPLPRVATTGDQVMCSAKPQPGYAVDAITVHREPLPQPLAVRVANSLSTYKLPDDRREYLPRLKSIYRKGADGSFRALREEYSDGRTGDFGVAENGAFNCAIPLRDGPGLYTVVVWVRPIDAKSGITIPASNVTIRVDEAPSDRTFDAGSGR